MRRIDVCLIPGLLSFAALGACSPAVGEAESSAVPAGKTGQEVHAESGLPVIPLVVKSGNQTHEFAVEISRSRYQQAKGLMFRASMGANEGMLFPFDPPRDASFWMKNTVIALDIIFIGADGRILNIEANAVPYSETPRSSRGKAAAVLELVGGRAARLGIVPGDTVEW